ncbi:aminodeoxychorismate synthase component I [Thalassotalea fusca]
MHHKEIIAAKPLNIGQSIKPQALFAKIANLPWAIWLDSCASDHVDSQFDIMVWQPVKTITTVGKQTDIFDTATRATETASGDPLELLESQQQALFAQYIVEQSALPFHGGALGYFSYDLGRRFETLPSQAVRDIDMPEMAVGLYTHAIIFDRKSNKYWLICPEKQRSTITEQINAWLQQALDNPEFKLTSAWQTNITKAEYQQKFQQVQSYLQSGDCYQINLTQRFNASYDGDEFAAYCKLRQANKAPFSAFIRLPEFAILSISPERFLQVRNGHVQTKPIKGTVPRSDDPTQDAANAKQLLSSEKDRAENLMIVDLLRNDLSRVCEAGSVKVPKLFDVESFPAVHHLVSTVEGKLSENESPHDLLRASFPGGSITGAPKIRAMEIIDELEPQRRSIYCGSIGYLSACGHMDTSITIRTLVGKDNQMYCWAGGGIVADSQVDAEYQETFDKVNKILPILGTR